MSLSESRLRRIEARIAGRTAAPGLPTLPVPPRFRWLKPLVISAVVYLMFLGAVRVWWGVEAKRRFDAAVATYRGLGQPVLLEDFQRPPIPDERNGGPLLQRALELLSISSAEDEWFRYAASDLYATIAHAERLRALMARSQSARALAAEGLSRPAFHWGPELQRPLIQVLFPELSGVRQLTRILSVEALLHAADGDAASSLESVERILRTAVALRGYAPSTITHLVTVSVDATAATTIQEIAPDLAVASGFSGDGAAPREQVLELVAALLDDRERGESLARAMCSERLFQVDCALSLFEGSTGLDSLTTTTPPPSTVDAIESKLLGPMFLLDGVKMMRWSNGLITAAAARNWTAAVQALPPAPPGPRSVVSLGGLSRVLSQILVPSLDRAIVLHFRSLALRRMAAIALAIRLYQIDHGQRPASLNALVPAYLPSMPQDPFNADGQPFGYVPQGPWLYSVGVDGVDDGGMYGLKSTGSLDYDALDLVFFLTRDFPRARAEPPNDTESAAPALAESENEENQPPAGTSPGEAGDPHPPESRPAESPPAESQPAIPTTSGNREGS